MKEVNGELILEKPKDLFGFTLDGVTLKRTTMLHQVGHYNVTDQEGGVWVVRGQGSNRYPWEIEEDRDEGPVTIHHSRNLIDCARFIASYRRRHPRSPYRK